MDHFKPPIKLLIIINHMKKNKEFQELIIVPPKPKLPRPIYFIFQSEFN